MNIPVKIAQRVIALSQLLRLGGKGNYALLGKDEDASSATSQFPQAEEEARRYEEFFTFFATDSVRDLLMGKRVLDLGCGYGGRSVMYASRCGAAEVIGVEIFPHVVELAKEYAAKQEAANCRFELATQASVGLEDESVDVVVSYDVLEHVDDPRTTMKEIWNVLKPNGLVLLVFTPYHGMLSHHLGYITRVPGIHWFFSPTTLVNAINGILGTEQGARKFGVPRQPFPQPSYNGRRICLPGLNGLTSNEFRQLISGFEVLEMRQTPLLERYRVLGGVGATFNKALLSLGDWPRDAFSFNLSCVLRKPEATSSIRTAMDKP